MVPRLMIGGSCSHKSVSASSDVPPILVVRSSFISHMKATTSSLVGGVHSCKCWENISSRLVMASGYGIMKSEPNPVNTRWTGN